MLHAPVLSTAPSFWVEQRDDRLLVRDRDAHPLDPEPLQRFERRHQAPGRDQERDHHLVQAEAAERRVVDRRAQALLDRVADDRVDLGLAR